ncbi:MAG: ATP-grasp domain-containing protein [Methylococcaceae bacterium]|nr:ATP-grasp domain-containing protein [Methylococcaceae bacterium]
MLAESAARGGIKACVVDVFGDEDTRACAAQTVTVSRLTEDEIVTAAKRSGCQPGASPLIYGSGIDSQPNLVARLAHHFPLAGNTPETVPAANDPGRFFPLLERLRIPYPETRLERPTGPGPWLTKSACGEGGNGVAFCANFGRDVPGIYFQRWLPGTTCSLLFLAARGAIVPIGFNTLWHDHRAPRPFLFAGAVNRSPINDAQQTEMIEIATRLASSLDLRGINSLDFIADQERVWLLELNPRPSATQQLYEADWYGGLVRHHIDACVDGSLPKPYQGTTPMRGFRTIFAPVAVRVPLRNLWPPNCSDRPAGGTLIGRGTPVCTVHAQADALAGIRTQLDRLKTAVLNGLEPIPDSAHNPGSTTRQ